MIFIYSNAVEIPQYVTVTNHRWPNTKIYQIYLYKEDPVNKLKLEN